MKKKIIGVSLIACGIMYFLAMFRYMDFFESLNDILSYILFIAAVIAIVFGTMLSLFQKPEEHENEQAVRQGEAQILKENACCTPMIVYILLGVNLAAFLLINILQGEDSVLFYAVSKSERGFYRIITAMFIHVDIEHLLLNMLTLCLLGKRLESLIGRLRFFRRLSAFGHSVLHCPCVVFKATVRWCKRSDFRHYRLLFANSLSQSKDHKIHLLERTLAYRRRQFGTELSIAEYFRYRSCNRICTRNRFRCIILQKIGN